MNQGEGTDGTASGAPHLETAAPLLPDQARRWWILAAVGIGTLMSALDGRG